MKKIKYFSVCKECGGISWMTSNSDSGWTMGDLLSSGDTNLLPESDVPYSFCAGCEAPTEAISFKVVGLPLRKKIYRMSKDQRKEWLRSYLTMKKLTSEEKNKEEDTWNLF